MELFQNEWVIMGIFFAMIALSKLAAMCGYDSPWFGGDGDGCDGGGDGGD